MSTAGHTNFDSALRTILFFEGGYVNNPNDPGGATNYGITQATYDAWMDGRGYARRPVRDITHDEVRAIYWERYWHPARCPDLPEPIDIVHFDAAVNTGVKRAAILLQRVLGVAQDGIIGSVTLAAALARPPVEIVHDLLFERLRYYATLARAQRKDGRDLREFLPGWVMRVAHLRTEALRGG